MATKSATTTALARFRHSVMSVGALTLGFFAVAIISSNAYFAMKERTAAPLRNAEMHSQTISEYVSNHAAGHADIGSARSALQTSFQRSDLLSWGDVQIWSAENASAVAADVAARTPLSELASLRLTDQLRATDAARTALAFQGHIVTANVTAEGYLIVLAYDRAVLTAQAVRPPIARWVIGLLLLTFACTALLFAVRRLVQDPVRRLSNAIEDAEKTGELRIEPALPSNEIGRLANQISSWLERLRKTRAELSRMAMIVDRTGNAALILTRTLKIRWVNKAFENLSGYTADEMKGRTLGSLMVHGDINKEASLNFRKSVRAGDPCVEELLIECKDGTQRWIVAELQPVRDAQGRVTGWTGINTDITAQKAAEEELAARVSELERLRGEQAELTKELELAKRGAERANSSKSDFLANMSHEIRTPMNGVLGMADVLMAGELSDEQRDYVSTIQDSGAALLSIINDILDLSKLEAGHIELDDKPVDMAHTAEAVVKLMRPRAEAKGLKLTAHIADDLPEQLLGDEGRLRQIMMNLVGNAVKFTGCGQVDLRVGRAKSGAIRVEVQDTGAGISETLQARLFERFSQGDESLGDRPGTGLGLSISQELVTLMGGAIGVESIEGEGSTFWFEVPLKSATDNGEGRPMEHQDEVQKEAQSLRILLAEDHPVNQSLMKAFVAKLGHELEIADDGVDAVKAARDGTFDLILMDIQMPRMDGVMATKVIRSLETDAATIPIIAVTAHAMAGQREHYLSAGMNGYVSKPVQLATLEEEITRVLAESTVDTAESDDADVEQDQQQAS